MMSPGDENYLDALQERFWHLYRSQQQQVFSALQAAMDTPTSPFEKRLTAQDREFLRECNILVEDKP